METVLGWKVLFPINLPKLLLWPGVLPWCGRALGIVGARCTISVLEIKIFVWLALHNRLWTADRLAKRNLQHPPQCVLCCQEDEAANHLLLGCSFSCEIWYNVLLGKWLHRFTPHPGVLLRGWWPQVSAAVRTSYHKELNVLICCTMRMIWLERNNWVFDRVQAMPSLATKHQAR